MAILTVTNGTASFTFDTGVATGIRLTSFTRGEGVSWTNDSTELFRLVVFDTTAGVSTATSTVLPAAAKLTSAAVVGQTLTAVYTGIVCGGGDLINVTVVATIPAGKDWLDVTVTAAWNGVPTVHALDSIEVLPLLVQAKNRTSDWAIIPNTDGILSEDPTTYLRYDPTGGKTGAPFGRNFTNDWCYPSGRGIKHPVFAYWSAVTREAWMTWLEQGDNAAISLRFEGDGSPTYRMLYETNQPQENNMLVGNSSSTLGSNYHFCLRPFIGETDCVAGEVGRFYGDRRETLAPSWLPDKRPDNTNLSDIERANFVHCSLDHSFYSGSSSYITSYLTTLRTNLGLTDATPFFGTGYFSGNVQNPYEVEILTDRAAIAAAYAAGFYLGPYTAGGFTPTHWSKYRWKGNQLRWWTNILDYQAYRLSRAGFYIGGADARAEEQSSDYYLNRTYPITAWNAGTKVLSITGDPTLVGFVPTRLTATIVPPLATSRLASAEVANPAGLAAGSITTLSNFIDGAGNTVVPDATYTVVLSRSVNRFEARQECLHALNHSAVAMAALKDATLGGRFAIMRASTAYLDTYTDPLHPQLQTYQNHCYADHGGWANIDGGYTNHPAGGGTWYWNAKADFIDALVADVRARQVAHIGTASFQLDCEDVDETNLSRFDRGWHATATLYLWRDMRGEDQEANKYRGFPLSSYIDAGRTLRRAPLNGMTSALAIATHPSGGPSPRTDATLHASFGYYMGSEWAYGLLMPEFTLWSDDTNGTAIDLYNNSIYASAGGPVSNTVRSLRDFNRSMIVAETDGWILEYLRYGTLLPLLTPRPDRCTFTTGMSYGSDSFYFDSQVVYRKASYPAVVHAPWRSRDGTKVGLILVNWTTSAANFATEIPLNNSYWNFGTGKAVSCKHYNSSRQLQSERLYEGGQSVPFESMQVPALSWELHTFETAYDHFQAPKQAMLRWPMRY